MASKTSFTPASSRGASTRNSDRASPNDWLRRDYGETQYSPVFDRQEPEMGRQSHLSSGTLSSGSVYSQIRRPSGSRGMLGNVLEKMHQGEILSQHDVSAALRDYNQLQTKMADLEQKAKMAKLHIEEVQSVDTAAAGGNLGKDERDKLMEQIKRKDRMIDEYQKRLKNSQTNSKSSAPKAVYTSDLAPPEKTVDRFCNVYENEWSNAFEVLKKSHHGDDEKAAFFLFRVVKHAYVFCFDMAEMQRHTVEDVSARLQEVMLQPSFTHPVSKLKYKPSVEVSTENLRHIETGQQLLQNYRAGLVLQTVSAVQELFRKIKLPELFDSGLVSKAVIDFANKVVEVIWLMVVQDPPMVVHWLEPKQTVVKQHFKYFKRKGPVVQQTVWPAIFSKDGGDLLSKGVVLACKLDELE